MIKSKKIGFCLVLLLVTLIAPISFAVDDSFKPYLHKPNIPEHPKTKLYGKYSTELFPGAGTYTYELELPKGTNNLQPSLTVSYNSQSMKQRPSFLGAGWSLTQNYIQRDINFTPSNTTDDEFKLILNNANYDLIYDNNDNFFHTETETFARIQNLTTNSNSLNQYWLVTLKDGTQLRFGYNPDSELISNSGYNYALKWSLDRISDTHNNNISYIYSENPYPEDSGSVYLSQILYNNDQKRKIDFIYESSNRPDRRKVFEHGNTLEETRRLTDVNVLFNDTLVRRYHFDFVNLNDEKSLTSLANITYFGNDNLSKLHTISFDYYLPGSYYTNASEHTIPEIFTQSAGDDLGIRLLDLNNDGYIDIAKGIANKPGTPRAAWLNSKNGWVNSSEYAPPWDFSVYLSETQQYVDYGLRAANLNGDGLIDLIYGRDGITKAWLNNGSGWVEDSSVWAPPMAFLSGVNDLGVQVADFNGDGRDDLLQGVESSSLKKAYLNTGRGWKDVSSTWVLPTYLISNAKDYGSRLVDANGDGLIDILKDSAEAPQGKGAWLNNGSGWTSSPEWKPPIDFINSQKADLGVRLVDVNGDGLTDMLQDYVNATFSENKAWLNNGSGWVESNGWVSPEDFVQNGRNVGRRIGDVNGDGFADILVGYNDGTDRRWTAARNSTRAYLLKNITNELGGQTYLYYAQSTKYNNTKEDGISDIGFNVWVVEKALQNNMLSGAFESAGSINYSYSGGFYDNNNSEFRGFNVVNETLADNTTITHYFHQNKELKGKEYRTETFDNSGNIFSKTENDYNFTLKNNSVYVAQLKSSSNYLYDGINETSIIMNVSYRYDDYSNIISKISYGNVFISGDEKYENYSFVYNTSLNILDKVSKYQLFNSNQEKIRETKYFYDNKEHGKLLKGDLTKTEQWLDTGGGNPTTYYVYDSFGNLIKQTDALGNTVTYDYGLMDITHTYPERITNALGHAVDFEYDVATGNILSTTKNGITTYSKYDVFGRIIKEILPYDTNDLPTKTYAYSFDGTAPESTIVKQKTTSNNTLDVYYFYDGFANLVQIKTPAEEGQVVKNLFYDGLFRVKEEQNPYFFDFSTNLADISDTANRTRYNYDALGRIISVINPDGTQKRTVYNHSEINDFDENNNRHTYLLDSYDKIIAVTEYNQDYYLLDNETYNTTYNYNGADELTGIRDTYGNHFNFTYDSLGRKIKLKDPDLGTLTYSYDSTGNIVKQTYNNGEHVDMGYDPLNRILNKNYTEENIAFVYDKQYYGTLYNVSYPNIAYTYSYDDRLRIIKEIAHLENQSFETGNTYNSMDRVIQKVLEDKTEMEFYYNVQNKIDKINGFINKTHYNALGNPSNRTYLNGRVTSFDYYSNNLRLKQIKTDNVQSLNYSYDNVGNIVSINDSVNNRSYAMTYDNLDRLTNVSINKFSWVYSYDAIGRILKVIRNSTETTSLKYGEGPLHAPHKLIKTYSGIDVYRNKGFNTSNKTKVFEFYLINEKNTSLTNVNWTAEFGDSSVIDSNQLFNLSLKDNVLVILEHNYSKGDNYRINFTGRSSSTANDYESINLIFGAIANHLNILKQNGTTIVSEFSAKNTINQLSQNWSWDCGNGVISTKPFNMSPNQELMVIVENNYTLREEYNLTCKINSTDGNQSASTRLTFDKINIENYNSTILDTDTVLVNFQIKNYYSSLNNINWNITADNKLYNASGISLNQGETTSISQEINFTNAGLKTIKVTIGSGNLTDAYTENVKIYSLGVKDFINIVKNGTTRIFNFIVENNWYNLTAKFNVSNPVIENTTSLNQTESLIVVIEENYGQGNKQVDVKVFNNSVNEDSLLEIFRIRQIEISSLQTLHENGSRSVISSVVKNNINSLNLSWQLNNSEELITSNQNLELNTSEQGIVIIESNYSTSGIYPLIFVVNSSTYNDNATGVSVS